MRDSHPLQGKTLQLFGWAHRKGVLNLTLVLPDGSRSYIPASWTDLDSDTLTDFYSKAAIIGTILHMLQARKVVDALLCKLDDSEQHGPTPSNEESKHASTTIPVAPRKVPATRNLAKSHPQQQKRAHRSPGQIDRKGSSSTREESAPGGQP